MSISTTTKKYTFPVTPLRSTTVELPTFDQTPWFRLLLLLRLFQRLPLHRETIKFKLSHVAPVVERLLGRFALEVFVSGVWYEKSLDTLTTQLRQAGETEAAERINNIPAEKIEQVFNELLSLGIELT